MVVLDSVKMSKDGLLAKRLLKVRGKRQKNDDENATTRECGTNKNSGLRVNLSGALNDI